MLLIIIALFFSPVKLVAGCSFGGRSYESYCDFLLMGKKRMTKKEKYKGKNGPKAKKDQENCRIKKNCAEQNEKKKKKLILFLN